MNVLKRAELVISFFSWHPAPNGVEIAQQEVPSNNSMPCFTLGPKLVFAEGGGIKT
jgi:hypothetical protein